MTPSLQLPTISLLATGVCALIQFGLTVGVIVRRAQIGVDFFDGGDQVLMRRSRAHGNFAETVPLVLLTLALLEMHGASQPWLVAMAGCLVLGRLLHALSLLTNNARWSRIGGMALTLIAMSLGGAAAVALATQRL